MSLDKKQRLKLSAQAHSLKPVVLLGNKGLTEAVINEINLALTHHELMKVKVPALDKTVRIAIINEICQKTEAELVQILGQIATLYRKNKDK